MVRFPQITLREWSRSFPRVMKLIERVRSEQKVCEVERTLKKKKLLLTELRSRPPLHAADLSAMMTAVPHYIHKTDGGGNKVTSS